jgi:YVTN family beta-propeller protein
MRRTLRAAALISVTTAVAATTTAVAATTTAAAASAASGTARAGTPDTQVTATIQVGNDPQSVAVDAQTDRVYVLNNGAHTLSVINGKSNKVLATLSVGSASVIAVNPQTDRIYVLTGFGTVKVISGQTDKTVATVKGLGSASKDGIAVNSQTNTIYVTNQYVLKNGVVEDGTVSVISGRTDKVAATVPAGSVPEGIAADPRTNRVYVANAGSSLTPGTVSVINGQTDKVVATVLTSGFYTANSDANTVTAFDSQTDMFTAVIDVGTLPEAIATDTSTDTTYVANADDGTVSVLTP